MGCWVEKKKNDKGENAFVMEEKSVLCWVFLGE